MTVGDHLLAWRNLVVQWHADRGFPGCRCDDDTPAEACCAESKDYADRALADACDPLPEGPDDRWEHGAWVSAWGRNAPLVASPIDYRLPKPPPGMSWLVTRSLARGQRVLDLTLMRSGDGTATVVGRTRAPAIQGVAALMARRVLGAVGG